MIHTFPDSGTGKSVGTSNLLRAHVLRAPRAPCSRGHMLTCSVSCAICYLLRATCSGIRAPVRRDVPRCSGLYLRRPARRRLTGGGSNGSEIDRGASPRRPPHHYPDRRRWSIVRGSTSCPAANSPVPKADGPKGETHALHVSTHGPGSHACRDQPACSRDETTLLFDEIRSAARPDRVMPAMAGSVQERKAIPQDGNPFRYV